VKPSDMQAAYGGASSAWAAGPAGLYRAMAQALVDHCPVALAGARVLDFGAGTGATTAALVDAGARVIAADLTVDMLMQDRVARPPCVNANALALPFAPRVFEVAVGAFVISHIDAPVDALAEVARTTRRGGAVMTLGFDRRWEFGAKELIDGALVHAGATIPPWYDEFKNAVEPLTAYPERLDAVARDAGLSDVRVIETAVDLDVRDAPGLVAWRTGNPIFAPFLAGLDASERDSLLDSIYAALGPDPAPLVPELLVLSGRVA
jgi:ubiquinone/menaquinone biosynthesis C-methylase UbiE